MFLFESSVKNSLEENIRSILQRGHALVILITVQIILFNWNILKDFKEFLQDFEEFLQDFEEILQDFKEILQDFLLQMHLKQDWGAMDNHFFYHWLLQWYAIEHEVKSFHKRLTFSFGWWCEKLINNCFECNSLSHVWEIQTFFQFQCTVKLLNPVEFLQNPVELPQNHVEFPQNHVEFL